MSWVLVLALAPFLLALAVVCIRDPLGTTLPLYAATIPFGDALSVASSPFASASSLIGLLLGLGLVAQLATSRATTRRLTPPVALWLLFLALALATSLWTIDPGETISDLAVLTSLVLIFLIGAVSAVDGTAIRRTESALIVGGVLVVVYGVLQLTLTGGFGSAPGASVEETRFGDDMIGPNILAVTLLMPLALALHRAFNPRIAGRPFLYVLTVGVLLAGILMTGSRTGTLGAGLVVVALMVTSPPRARSRLAATLLAGAVVATGVWVYHPFGLATRTFESPTSTSGRFDIWEVGFAACQHYCGWGAGWGTFPRVYTETLASVPAARVLGSSDTGAYEAHNVWLLALIETGFLGALLLTLALGASTLQALRLPARSRAPAVAMMVGLIAGLMFLSSIEFKIFWLVVLLVAMYANADDLTRSRPQESPSGRREPTPHRGGRSR